MSAMNFWPPNPGSTVIIRTISTSSTTGKTDSTGVLGLIPIPTLRAVTYSHKCKNVTVHFCKKLAHKLFTFIPAFLIWFIKSTGLSKEKAGNIIILFDYLLLTKSRLPVTEKLLAYDSHESCILEKWLRKHLSTLMNKPS